MRMLTVLYNVAVLNCKERIMLVLKVILAGLLLSFLATLAVWAMCYVEARRGNDTEARR